MSDNQKICPTCSTEYPLSERFCPRDGTALRAAANQSDLLGSVVADRYHILKKLGAGGMGTVYLAEHVKMGRKSALKVMNPGMNTDPDAVARFNREASNASRLSHPNVCGIYDFGETADGMIYLAMEYIEGSTLTDLIEQDAPLQPRRAASIIHQTADALQIAHDAGIVHRDLKPDNIMVAKHRDGSDLVKVVDFGIAKASTSDAQKVTKTGMVVGTPEYMSPEQLAGDKLDGRSDIYALGLVAFNCLTGALPFAATSAQEAMIMRLTDLPRALAEVRPDVDWPHAVQVTLDLALARDATDRYQSAAQFGREFSAALAEMSPHPTDEAGTVVMNGAPETRTTDRARSATPAPEPAPRRTTLRALGGVGATIAIAAVAWNLGVIGGSAAPAGQAAATAAGTPPTPEVVERTAVAPTTRPSPRGGAPVPSSPQPGTGSRTAGPPSTQSRVAPPDPAPSASATPALAPASMHTPTSVQTAGASATTGTAVPAAPNPMTQMAGWLRDVQSPTVTAATARRVIGDIQQLRPALSGLPLGESYYLEVIAFTVLENERAVCQAARRMRELHTERARLAFANNVLTNFCVDP
ncbi:MAG: hypothetical protein RLZZ63_1352 [Gemmatimonadota bacterium]